MHFIKCFLFIVLVLISSCKVLPSSDLSDGPEPDDAFARAGIEIELRANGFLSVDPASIPDRLYLTPLELIRQNTEAKQSPPEIRPHEKGKMAVMEDSNGLWKVEPEWTHGIKADGFELVTPPLTESEQEEFFKALEVIIESKEYSAGRQSGSHISFDVSHLIADPNDANKLVDLMVFLESAAPLVYAAISPKRAGSIVNRFMVPLAFNQRDMLRELAGLDRSQTSLSRVKSIFERYWEREVRLNAGNESAAFKFRSWNYRKLLGLRADHVPIIECRIPDVMDADDYRLTMNIIRRLLRKGTKVERRSFKNPFHTINANADLSIPRQASEAYDAAMRVILSAAQSEDYVQFIDALGLNAESVPPLRRLQGSLTVPLPLNQQVAKLKRDIAALENHSRFPFTYGFEVEYKPDAAFEQGLDFNVFEERITSEGTGNREARSLPSGDFDFINGTMESVKQRLGENLRGFHLHTRFNAALLDGYNQEEFRAYLSRIGDMIFAWRAQTRRSFFGFNVWSQTRANPQKLGERGTVRVRTLSNGEIDIEIRGFMGDANEIATLMYGLEYALKSGNFQGFKHFQAMTFLPLAFLQDKIQIQYNSHGNQGNIPAGWIGRITTLRESIKNPDFTTLPFCGFEAAPYLSETERIKISNANEVFYQRVYLLVADESIPNEALGAKYRAILKKWTTEVDLYHMLSKTIVMSDAERRSIEPANLSSSAALIDKIGQIYGQTEGDNPTIDREQGMAIIFGLIEQMDAAALEKFTKTISDDRWRDNEFIFKYVDSEVFREAELSPKLKQNLEVLLKWLGQTSFIGYGRLDQMVLGPCKHLEWEMNNR